MFAAFPYLLFDPFWMFSRHGRLGLRLPLALRILHKLRMKAGPV